MSSQAIGTPADSLVCPQCRRVLQKVSEGQKCESCDRLFANTPEGYTNLLIVDGFADQVDMERGLREERMAEVLIDGY
jgi:hypothetical protein